jgi:hypothetical protein
MLRYIMKRNSIVLIFILFSLYPILFAQQSKNNEVIWKIELKEAYSASINSKSMAPLEEFSNKQTDILQRNNDFLSAYYGYRFKYFHIIIMPSLSKKEQSAILEDKDLQVYIQDLKKYKEVCADCYICGLVDKYKTYQKLNLLQFYQPSDKEEIFSKGYKKSKEGPGINIQYIYSSRNFFGIEYTLKAFHEPSYTIKEKNSNSSKFIKKCANHLDFMASFVSFGINYNPKDKHTQVVINPFSLNAPLLVKPLQIGIEFSPQKNVFFYRPEVGLGYKGLSLLMGYNLVFRKELRLLMDKWVFTTGFAYVLNR